MTAGGRSRSFKPKPTPHGHPLDEAASALQKCIRRSMEDDALYWAVQLDEGGYAKYLWRRLTVIASEDIGLAEPGLHVQLAALKSAWEDLRAQKSGMKPERLFIAHAVMLCARARKDREVDHATCAHYWEHDTGDLTYRRETPDVALDKHTSRGRQMGRSWDHFLEEGSRLIDPDGEEVSDRENEYRERAAKIVRIQAGLEEEDREPEQPQLPVNGEGDK